MTGPERPATRGNCGTRLLRIKVIECGQLRPRLLCIRLLNIALDKLPMRGLEVDLSVAAHEGGARRRIETETIGQPCGGIAEVAINADQAGHRGCGIAAWLTGNVVMRWTDQGGGEFRHADRYGGIECGERLFSHLRRRLQLDRWRDRNIVGAVDKEHRSLRDVRGVQHLIRGTEAELLT